MSLVERLRRFRIVPVITIADAGQAEPLGRALSESGLPCAEITFRTHAAAESIERIRSACPDVLVGAGTILSRDQASSAARAGAQFIVSPGFNQAVVDHCLERGLPVFPGVCTPTEIEMALGRDLRVLKFFPAEAMGGVRFLSAISAPYGGVSFIPTGGINAANIGHYLALDSVVACGGSWLAPSDWIAAGDFTRIREETARALAAAGVLRVNT